MCPFQFNTLYIATDEIPMLSREVQCDPIMALDGGKNGLALIQQLVEQAPKHLAAGGHLLLEIGQGQEKEIIKLLETNDYSDIFALPDYQGVIRFIEARRT